MTPSRDEAARTAASSAPDGWTLCGYGCGYRARFYVGDDKIGSYCCARHLAFYVRQHQALAPDEWLKVCELTDE